MNNAAKKNEAKTTALELTAAQVNLIGSALQVMINTNSAAATELWEKCGYTNPQVEHLEEQATAAQDLLFKIYGGATKYQWG